MEMSAIVSGRAYENRCPGFWYPNPGFRQYTVLPKHSRFWAKHVDLPTSFGSFLECFAFFAGFAGLPNARRAGRIVKCCLNNHFQTFESHIEWKLSAARIPAQRHWRAFLNEPIGPSEQNGSKTTCTQRPRKFCPTQRIHQALHSKKSEP